jgi:hypothetical protein
VKIRTTVKLMILIAESAILRAAIRGATALEAELAAQAEERAIAAEGRARRGLADAPIPLVGPFAPRATQPSREGRAHGAAGARSGDGRFVSKRRSAAAEAHDRHRSGRAKARTFDVGEHRRGRPSRKAKRRVVTMRPLSEMEKDGIGFAGVRFYFDPAHVEDRGVGEIADVVEWSDRLMSVVEGDDESTYEISDSVEKHVAEPIARMLNDHGDLVAEVKKLRALLWDSACYHEDASAFWGTDAGREFAKKLEDEISSWGVVGDPPEISS